MTQDQRSASLAEQALAEEARIERCALDLNYPTAFERGMVLEGLSDDYNHKIVETTFLALDRLRQHILKAAWERVERTNGR